MSRRQSNERRSVRWLAVWITLVLATGAGTLIPWAALAFRAEDMEAVESPLLLSVAHQFWSGPGRLYGPYGGRYPLVLIHAPLYYRLAGLAAWPLTRAGCDHVTAALATGRVLSVVGFLMALVAAFGLARLGSMRRGPGWWAALLVAATPVCSGLPFEVRPDMLGIGLQTTGILLVLSAIAASPIGNARLVAGFGCFALAACIKQHFVVAPVLSAFLLAGARARGRIGLAPVLRCVSIGLAIVAIYYGVEEWGSGGRMSRSIVVAAGTVGKVHPADWLAAGNFLLAVLWKCVGVTLLLAAAGLTVVAARRAGPMGTRCVGNDLDRPGGGSHGHPDRPRATARDTAHRGRIDRGDRPGYSGMCSAREFVPGRLAGRDPLDFLGRGTRPGSNPVAAQYRGLVQLCAPGRRRRLRFDGTCPRASP